MENLNNPKYLEFLLKNLVDNIRRIDMYSHGGPIEDNKNKTSHKLFLEQKKINQENQEEKSEKERMENSRGINNELNV
jgi:hypothetical protein